MKKDKTIFSLFASVFLLATSFFYSSNLSGQTSVDKSKDSPIVTLTSSNYDKEISEGLILVDFWAPWCGPCRRMAPTLNEIAKDYKNDVKIAKLNVDNYKKFALEKGIQALPTIIVYKDGKEISRIQGLVSKAELIKVITENTEK